MDAKVTEFCWRNYGWFLTLAPARYDGSACVIVADQNAVHTLTGYNPRLTKDSPPGDIDAWLLEKGYVPIW